MKTYQNKSRALTFTALVLSGLVVACGSGGGGGAGSSGSASTTGAICSGAAAECVSIGSAGNLGAASGYGILAKTGVSTVPGSVVTGNIGLSPTARVGLTGWSETSDVTDTYSTSTQVVAPGKLYADDYVGGTTKVDLGTAVGSMQTAYTEA
ncbi:MAG TPA: ice-binding family protein, partial [Burkholderiales bacterium]|nr:ice-binding family protein [Burkholderiales bacterium]